MKKNGKMAAVILAAVLVAATAGCSRNQSGEGGNDGTEALKTSGERQLNVLVEAGSPAFDVAEQTAVEFEEQTGIKVNIDAVPYSGMYDKLAAEVTSQAGLYDVACVDTVWMAGLKNGLLPLDDIVTDEMKLDFPETLVTDGTLDGTLYGLPAWANGKVLLYRTDLFEDNTEKENFKAKYGYELKVPGTWQEYLDVAEFFTRDNDKDGTIDMYGTSLSAKTGGDTVISFLEMAVQAGGTPLVLDSEQQVMVNQQAYVDALNHMKALYDAQCVPAGIFEMAAADHVKMFSEGKLAMAPVWCAMYTNAVDKDSSQVAAQTGVAVMPAGPEGVGIVPAPFYHVIMKGSGQQDAAAEYLKFINDKNSLYINRGMAGRTSVLEHEKDAHPQLKVLLDSMQSPLSEGRPKVVQWNEIESAINVVIQNVLKGQQTPEDALDALKSEIEEMF